MTTPQHTFLFADLAGFTRLTEERGDEAAADMATAFCDAVNALLPDGAEDLKSLGDACMIRLPDAGDAIRFALALMNRPSADSSRIAVRIGLHTGPAVQRRGDWFGASVNLAARVAEMAAADQVLVTDAVRAAAGPLERVAYQPLGRPPLRHVARPPRIYAASLDRAPRPPSASLGLGVHDDLHEVRMSHPQR